MIRYLTSLCIVLAVAVGCSKEPPPRTVTEFLDNPMLLEAAMVRCAQDRAQSRYVAECVNARAAAARIQAREEADRAAELESRSERKRQELRRAQEAAAEGRRRAEEAAERAREAEYLAQFGETPPAESAENSDEPAGNVPIVIIPEADDAPSTDLETVREELRRRAEEGNN
jgi:multidrug efflux pump subunit AcrA (membrane-fusion protein)